MKPLRAPLSSVLRRVCVSAPLRWLYAPIDAAAEAVSASASGRVDDDDDEGEGVRSRSGWAHYVAAWMYTLLNSFETEVAGDTWWVSDWREVELRVEWRGEEWSGVEWRGVEWSGIFLTNFNDEFTATPIAFVFCFHEVHIQVCLNLSFEHLARNRSHAMGQRWQTQTLFSLSLYYLLLAERTKNKQNDQQLPLFFSRVYTIMTIP